LHCQHTITQSAAFGNNSALFFMPEIYFSFYYNFAT